MERRVTRNDVARTDRELRAGPVPAGRHLPEEVDAVAGARAEEQAEQDRDITVLIGVSPVEIAIWCGRSVSTSREFQNRII